MQTTKRTEKFFRTVMQKGAWSTEKRLRNHVGFIFEGIELAGKRMLDIGGGTGILSLYAAAAGAREVICLEPEAEGSSAGMQSTFTQVRDALRLPNVQMLPATLQESSVEGPFDVIISQNSINHLDEEAVARLPGDPAARARYTALAQQIAALSAPGADLIIADCSNRNVFGDLGLRNPILPTVDWRIHQPPEVWADIFAPAGFTEPRVRWSSINALGRAGRLLGSRAVQYFLMSHFQLNMRRSIG